MLNEKKITDGISCLEGALVGTELCLPDESSICIKKNKSSYSLIYRGAGGGKRLVKKIGCVVDSIEKLNTEYRQCLHTIAVYRGSRLSYLRSYYLLIYFLFPTVNEFTVTIKACFLDLKW